MPALEKNRENKNSIIYSILFYENHQICSDFSVENIKYIKMYIFVHLILDFLFNLPAYKNWRYGFVISLF